MLNDLQKEQNKERQQRYRDKQKALQNDNVTQENVTLIEDRNVTHYPAIILALADPVKKEKLQRIADSLRNHNQLEGVRYGIGGPTFTQVSQMLDVLV